MENNTIADTEANDMQQIKNCLHTLSHLSLKIANEMRLV